MPPKRAGGILLQAPAKRRAAGPAVPGAAAPKQQPPRSAEDVEAEELELQQSRVKSNFRKLELVLKTLRTGGKVSAWEVVCSSVEQMSSDSFDLEDLAVIISIWPEAFSCTWRVASSDPSKPKALHLIVTAALSQPTGSFTGGTRSQNRMNHFNFLLAQWIETNKGVKMDAAAALGVLPQRPLTFAGGGGEVAGGSPGVARSGTAASAAVKSPKRKSALSQFSLSERQELQARNSTSHVPVERSAASVSGGIEQLRLEAIERERASKLREEHLQLERQRAANIATLKALLPLCDALRSLALSRNKRSSFVTTELLRELVLSLRISEAELKTRLAKVAEELPEFLTLLPADERVSVETVRVNLVVEYAEVRRKCQQLVDKAKS